VGGEKNSGEGGGGTRQPALEFSPCSSTGPCPPPEEVERRGNKAGLLENNCTLRSPRGCKKKEKKQVILRRPATGVCKIKGQPLSWNGRMVRNTKSEQHNETYGQAYHTKRAWAKRETKGSTSKQGRCFLQPGVREGMPPKKKVVGEKASKKEGGKAQLAGSTVTPNGPGKERLTKRTTREPVALRLQQTGGNSM